MDDFFKFQKLNIFRMLRLIRQIFVELSTINLLTIRYWFMEKIFLESWYWFVFNVIKLIWFYLPGKGANLRSSLSDPRHLEAITKCAKRAILSFQPVHIVHEDSAFIVPLSRIAIIMFCGNWAMIEWCEETLPTFG